MSTSFILGLIGAWVLCGVTTGFVMRRRGHDLVSWLLIGAVLGPFVIPLAVERTTLERSTDTVVRVGEHTPGPLDLLVGLDGSPESGRALESAMRFFGTTASTITLATVVDYDAPDSDMFQSIVGEAQAMLDEAVAALDRPDVATKVLFGKPDRALADFATTTGKELIVIGPRGHGAAKTVFGSVASTLAAGCAVPVLVGACDHEPSLPYMQPD